MGSITGWFLKGLATILPLAVTVGIIVWLARGSERFFSGLLQPHLEEWYFPGLGLAITVLLVLLVGILAQAYLFRRLVAVFEGLFLRIPLIKTIYSSVQDLMEFIQETRQRKGQQVVMVEISLGDYQAKIMGFVTRDDYSGLPEAVGGDDMVTVYLPMSYQIGGYAVVIPRDRITPVDMSIEQGMRYAVTAGLTTSGIRKDRR
ncbi:MAG: DUF502 domain-containing protein [Planctomycetota bacterium]|nr:MAG: DUF502 domain-containing protein [Planctomycetota bacterium]